MNNYLKIIISTFLLFTVTCNACSQLPYPPQLSSSQIREVSTYERSPDLYITGFYSPSSSSGQSNSDESSFLISSSSVSAESYTSAYQALDIDSFDCSDFYEATESIFGKDKSLSFYADLDTVISEVSKKYPHIATCRVVIKSQHNIGYMYNIPYLFASGLTEERAEKRLSRFSSTLGATIVCLDTFNATASAPQSQAHSEAAIFTCLASSDDYYSLTNIVNRHNASNPFDEAFSAVIQIKNKFPMCKSCQALWSSHHYGIVGENQELLEFSGANNEAAEQLHVKEILNKIIPHSVRISAIGKEVLAYPTSLKINRCGLGNKN